MGTCSICTHPHCAAIEAALVAGQSYRSIAGQFQCSKSSIVRHRQHSATRSPDRASLRHQALALQRQAQSATNITIMAQVVQKLAGILVKLCEYEK